MIRQHAIYGLYLPDQPDVILYAGSWRVATLDERLRQHREGKAPITRKMATKSGVNTGDLRMRVLDYWMSGGDNPEGEITIVLQAKDQCRWNFPHALSTEDSRRGVCTANGRMSPEERKQNARKGGLATAAGWSKTPRGHAVHVRCGHIGGPIGGPIGIRKTNETWGKTPEAHEHRVRIGRIGGAISGPINAAKISHEDRVRGARTANARMTPEQRQENARKGGLVGGRKGGLIGMRRMMGTWGLTLEAHDARVQAGYLRACVRWHPDRPKIDRLCAECAAKAAPIVPNSPR